MYPSSFDLLTTHGVIADDLLNYVKDTPSPYLQAYVAQRGWTPDVPGQVLPDTLPTLPPQYLPKTDVYQNGQHMQDINALQKKDKWDTTKKVGLAVLLTGLAVFGIVKGRQAVTSIKNFFNRVFHRP
jgi:hypothetical protein